MYSILLTEADKQFRAFLKQLLLLNNYNVEILLNPKGLIKKIVNISYYKIFILL